MPQFPPATRNFIIACVLIHIAQSQFGVDLLERFALYPIGAGFRPWQVLTYAFLHHDFTHLLMNMFGVWMLGRPLEYTWGTRRFTNYMIASALGTAVVQLVLGAMPGPQGPSAGASGVAFGLVLGFAMMYPRQTIITLPIPIPMPAWVFATLLGLLELVLGITGIEPDIAHFGHLGGMLGGFIMLQVWAANRR